MMGHFGFPWWLRVGPLTVHFSMPPRRAWWYWNGGRVHIAWNRA